MIRNTKNNVMYNCKKFVYPNGLVKVVLCNQKIFNNGYELVDDLPVVEVKENSLDSVTDFSDFDIIDSDIVENNKQHSIRRARQKIFDIAMLNHFTHFITLTFDKSKIDRYNDEIVYSYIQKYLNNCVTRKNLLYVLVPERHKDGALHFHGLMSGNFTFVDSGKTDKNNHIIYNIKDWNKGFSTAVKINSNSLLDDDYYKVCNYITKYITKQHSEMIKGRYYLSGGKLKRSVPTFYENVDFSEYDLPNYETGYGTSFKFFDYFDTNFNELLLNINKL